jgi:hypothetical protein
MKTLFGCSRNRRRFFAPGAVSATALLLGLAAALSAQTSGTAAVHGRVTDETGGAVAGAAVVVSNDATGFSRATRTDAQGRWTISELPLTGGYRLKISREGFAPQERGPFELRGGETASFNAVLSPAGVSTRITVSGTTEGVRADSPQLGTRFDAQKIDNTPLLGRKLTNLPLLNSAVRPARGTGDLFLNNTLFVIDGGGRRQTTYTIDGSTADDTWGRQTVFTNVPLGAVQELTVLTNSFSAEYGRTTGAAINLVTRSGTNALKGDLVGVYRPASLQPRAPVTGFDVGDQLWQGSGVLSGPIVSDRLYFLAGGEYNSQDRDSAITSPLAPGVYTGFYRQRLFFTRVDADLSSSQHLIARFNLDNFSDSNPQDAVGGLTLPSAGRAFRRNTYSGQLAETAVFSETAFNDARLLGGAGTPITQFDPLTPSPQLVRPGVSTEGESRVALLTDHQYQFADTFSLSLGSHFLKLGGDAISSRSGGNGLEFGAPFVLGQFTFKTGISPSIPTSQLTIADVARYTEGFGNVTYSVHETIWSAFAQDDWRPRSDLVLNLGLRYDRQTLTDAKSSFSPRIGFAYNPGGDTRTAIRGGYGIYYSEIRANIVAGFALNGPTGFFNFSVAPGQTGFPTSLTPVTSFPPGGVVPARDITLRPGMAAYYSQFLDTSKLRGYPDSLVNPKTDQATLGIEREIAPTWFLSLDGVHSHTTKIDRNLDLNAPSLFVRTAPGQTRSAAAADLTRPILPVNGGYRRVLVTVNTGESKYDALQVNLNKNFAGKAGLLASYTWSHTRNNVEQDAPGGDPNDFSQLNQEWADSLLDQRHRVVVSGWARLPLSLLGGGVVTAASGRPYNITTGADNNGDGANADRPVINGQVIGRNAGQGNSVYDISLFLAREFPLGAANLTLRAEVFNLTNHANVFGYNGVYGNDPSGTPLSTFGLPVGGVANVEPGRQFQFQARVTF